MKDSLYPLKRIQTIIRVAPTTEWSQSQHKLAISGKRGYRTLGKETLTFYNCWIWRKKKYLQNVSACKTDPDLKLKKKLLWAYHRPPHTHKRGGSGPTYLPGTSPERAKRCVSNCSRRRRARGGGWPAPELWPRGAGPWLGWWQPRLTGHPCLRLLSTLLVTSRASLSSKFDSQSVTAAELMNGLQWGRFVSSQGGSSSQRSSNHRWIPAVPEGALLRPQPTSALTLWKSVR